MRHVNENKIKNLGIFASSHYPRVGLLIFLSACIGGAERGSLLGEDSNPSTNSSGDTGSSSTLTSTDELSEGTTNLYYTDARSDARANAAINNNADHLANNAARHAAVTLGSANGLSLSGQQLSMAIASGSTTGALSSGDFNTFNSKEGSLSNPTGSSNSKVLTSTASGTRSWGYQSEVFNPGREIRMTEEWIQNATTGNLNWMAAVSGTGAAAAINTTMVTAYRPGVVQISTGTTATGRGILHLGTTALAAGGAKIVVETALSLSNVSNGTESYSLRVGLGDNIAAGDHTDGVYFEHNSTAANWQIKTANNSSRTTTDSGVAVSTNWTKLRFEIAEDGTSVEFFINGTSVGSITTDIPTAATRLSAPNIRIEKSLGTTARLVHLDYFNLTMTFSTTSR
jgi:hypothetical protein